MPELSEEAREFFVSKRRVERNGFLTIMTTLAANLASVEFGLPNAGPYVFTVGCLYTVACEADRLIDEAVRRRIERL